MTKETLDMVLNSKRTEQAVREARYLEMTSSVINYGLGLSPHEVTEGPDWARGAIMDAYGPIDGEILYARLMLADCYAERRTGGAEPTYRTQWGSLVPAHCHDKTVTKYR